MSEATRLPALLRWVLPASLVLAYGLACTSLWDDPAPEVADASEVTPDASPFPGAGVGGACEGDAHCRDGLACREARCVPAGDRGLDRKCILSAECAGPTAECPNGLNCGWFGFCVCAGEGLEGAPCTSSGDCAKGFVCDAVGFSGYCAPRPADGGDLGAPCEQSSGCLAGLRCSPVSRTCVPESLLLNPDLFPGVACEDESAMPFGVRMRLPRPGDHAGHFYSLPFPSDVRLKPDGRPDLATHPRPGPGIMGVDPLDRVIRAIEGEMDGFALDPSVHFRFTRAVDPSTVRTGPDPASGAPPTVLFVNLDDPAREVPFHARVVADRNKYICPNSLYVHPAWQRPLDPLATYAVVVTTGVRPAGGGEAPVHLDDLDILLSDTAPGGDGKAAWDRFAKLRAWMKTAGVAAADVAGATVFTTGDPVAPLRRMGEFFHPGPGKEPAAEFPSLDKVAECGTGADVTECLTPGWSGGNDPRACPASKPSGYTEYHATIRLPVFQEGDPPYLTGGGSIRMSGGTPGVVRYEHVCAAITIPDGPAPAAGWPVLIYGHGTGGDFTNGTRWADTLSAAGVVVLSIDQAMHGPRRGADQDPGPLFYNFANPPAARGNLIQGAADNFSLVRFVAGFEGKVGKHQVRFDSERVAYMGHSQGATTGPLFIPWEPGLRGAVFTGAGGSLVFGLLGKKKPYDASAGLRAGFQELHLDETHPGLALIQWYFDGTDPLTHGRALFDGTGTPMHVLDVIGWDDSYTPWRTSLIFAATLGGTLVYHPAGMDCRPDGCDPHGFDAAADLGMDTGILAAGDAYGANVDGAYSVLTIASRSDGTYDGHFVGERNAATRAALEHFLSTLLDPGQAVPTIRLGDDPCPGRLSAKCPE